MDVDGEQIHRNFKFMLISFFFCKDCEQQTDMSVVSKMSRSILLGGVLLMNYSYGEV